MAKTILLKDANTGLTIDITKNVSQAIAAYGFKGLQVGDIYNPLPIPATGGFNKPFLFTKAIVNKTDQTKTANELMVRAGTLSVGFSKEFLPKSYEDFKLTHAWDSLTLVEQNRITAEHIVSKRANIIKKSGIDVHKDLIKESNSYKQYKSATLTTKTNQAAQPSNKETAVEALKLIAGGKRVIKCSNVNTKGNAEKLIRAAILYLHELGKIDSVEAFYPYADGIDISQLVILTSYRGSLQINPESLTQIINAGASKVSNSVWKNIDSVEIKMVSFLPNGVDFLITTKRAIANAKQKITKMEYSAMNVRGDGGSVKLEDGSITNVPPTVMKTFMSVWQYLGVAYEGESIFIGKNPVIPGFIYNDPMPKQKTPEQLAKEKAAKEKAAKENKEG